MWALKVLSLGELRTAVLAEMVGWPEMAALARGESDDTAAMIRGEITAVEWDRRGRILQTRLAQVLQAAEPQAREIEDAVTRHREFFDAVAKMVIVEAKGIASGF